MATNSVNVIAKPIIVHKAFADLLSEKYLRLILLHRTQIGRVSESLLLAKADNVLLEK